VARALAKWVKSVRLFRSSLDHGDQRTTLRPVMPSRPISPISIGIFSPVTTEAKFDSAQGGPKQSQIVGLGRAKQQITAASRGRREHGLFLTSRARTSALPTVRARMQRADDHNLMILSTGQRNVSNWHLSLVTVANWQRSDRHRRLPIAALIRKEYKKFAYATPIGSPKS